MYEEKRVLIFFLTRPRPTTSNLKKEHYYTHPNEYKK